MPSPSQTSEDIVHRKNAYFSLQSCTEIYKKKEGQVPEMKKKHLKNLVLYKFKKTKKTNLITLSTRLFLKFSSFEHVDMFKCSNDLISQKQLKTILKNDKELKVNQVWIYMYLKDILKNGVLLTDL